MSKTNNHFRLTYSWEQEIFKPSFRQEFMRLTNAFIEHYVGSDDAKLATYLQSALLKHDNPPKEEPK